MITKGELRHLQEKERQLLELQRLYHENLPHKFGHKWYRWQRDFFESRNKITLLTAANQIGKALDVDTEISTPQGFRRMGDLEVGDFVIGRDGKPTRIIAVPFKGETECYRITFQDGTWVEASEDHLWICKGYEQRFKKKSPEYGQWDVVSTKQILKAGKYDSLEHTPADRFTVPYCEPVQYPEANVFDPYLVGLLIGNGGLTGGHVVLSSAELEIQEYIQSRYTVKPSGRFGWRLNGLNETLRFLGLMGCGSAEKHIPRQYMTASYEERLALFQGLMDTDGSIHGKGVIEYSTVSPQLMTDFVELVGSLGGTCKVTKRAAGYKKANGEFVQCQDAYRIILKVDFNPFRLKRKADRWYKISRAHERIIYSIEKVGKKLAKCITVDNEDGSFLATRDYIVTHNSTVQIWKCIEWATNKSLWGDLWDTNPIQFWYLYPDEDTAFAEWTTKWLPNWMPRGPLKDDPVYGWTADTTKRTINSITFNSGVHVFFKTYGQNTLNLQASTVHAAFTDEELPEVHWDELIMRLEDVKGYFASVFTPTRNQLFWYLAMECIGKPQEKLPEALKINVSAYDCLKFDDGSEGRRTVPQIEAAIARCRTKTEVQRRIFGRFVTEEGRLFPTFDPALHLMAPREIPADWKIYSGVDIGSGGNSHPAAIVFVAVDPDGTQGEVFRGWRGDDVTTTNGDIFAKYLSLRGDLEVTVQAYDSQAKDFVTIAERAGETFQKAEKAQDFGYGLVNTLFQAGALRIHATEELQKLADELMTVMEKTPKSNARDDYCDALRFSVSTAIPWDWAHIQNTEKPKTPPRELTPLEREIKERRGDYDKPEPEGWTDLNDEIAYWNELSGS